VARPWDRKFLGYTFCVSKAKDAAVKRRIADKTLETTKDRVRPRVFRELCARGVPRNAATSAAAHAQRWWRTARHPALNLALPPREFDRLGLPRLAT
jgi:hypothetical protein